jgi:hypothetical protein
VSEQYLPTLVNVVHSPNKNYHFGEAIGEVFFFFFFVILVIWLTKIIKKKINYFRKLTRKTLNTLFAKSSKYLRPNALRSDLVKTGLGLNLQHYMAFEL